MKSRYMNKRYIPKVRLTVFYVCSLSLHAIPPEPELGERWVRNDQYSDEFNGTKLNSHKWNDTFNGWKGRSPGYFNPNTISVKGGNLVIRNQTGVPSGVGEEYTLSGGAVQSKETTAHFGYYEANFKASRINMSTTFWLSNPKRNEDRTADPDDRFSQELDIAESIGGTGDFSSDFRKKMKFNTHYRWQDNLKTKEVFFSKGNNQIDIRDGELQGGDASLGDQESWETFHTYGCYWKDAKEATFYVNNNYIGNIVFRTDKALTPFRDPMRVNMVTETYNWAKPYPTKEQLDNNAINASYYNWVRSYVKLPIDQASSLDDEEETIYKESIQFKNFKVNQGSSFTYAFVGLYQTNKDKQANLTIKNAAGDIIKNSQYSILAGYGKKKFIVSLNAPLALGDYTVIIDIKDGINVIGSDLKVMKVTGSCSG